MLCVITCLKKLCTLLAGTPCTLGFRDGGSSQYSGLSWGALDSRARVTLGAEGPRPKRSQVTTFHVTQNPRHSFHLFSIPSFGKNDVFMLPCTLHSTSYTLNRRSDDPQTPSLLPATHTALAPCACSLDIPGLGSGLGGLGSKVGGVGFTATRAERLAGKKVGTYKLIAMYRGT